MSAATAAIGAGSPSGAAAAAAATASTITFANCNADICPYSKSFYPYKLDLAPNATFLALFSLSLLAFLIVLALTRRNKGFTLAMSLGLICEILGYAGRIISWGDQWNEPGFLMQTCCLTIAPAFLAAGIYLCIRRIVTVFGPENSRIAPRFYTRIFIPCDVISLILQALGGALASMAFHNSKSTDRGTYIMVAGLAFQVFTLVIFIGLCLDFFIRVARRRRSLGDGALAQDPALVALRQSKMFRGFLAALTTSTLLILWRSIFRVAEMSGGWSGPLMNNQDMFIGFEGVLITAAVWALNIFHPSLCFRRSGGAEHGAVPEKA